ncbi:DUF1501 domain-containing protein [Shimia ponticola]|uniref:DUF1501 domain-containing protein n=1 Tax=Shimia ponticola TaxID=2582893 RepID=UPI0011BE8A37|nr:DUF1501 domain-containing protein [Shimia ponticola]
MDPKLDRRSFLRQSLSSGLLGCSAAASPLITPVTFANLPDGLAGENRLVVIILRGAMDGLDVVRPVGDPDFAGLRSTIDDGQERLPLDGFYDLHPALKPLMPLWQAGQLGFAHAVATPYRDKRSHFDGQDILESGVASVDGVESSGNGWLNRMLTLMPGARAETAFAVGRSQMMVLAGKAPYRTWVPNTSLDLTPHAERLLEVLYHDDPAFREAALSADAIIDALATDDPSDDVDTSSMMAEMGMEMGRGRSNRALIDTLDFTLNRLVGETRIAAFSINGWDTHGNQSNRMQNLLSQLSNAILTLKAGLGSAWNTTTVLAMTEFGRTVRENGTKGTDHGTGGAMLMAGGAVRGGRVYGDWPGLSEADLYERRDLLPTADVRSYAGYAMQGLYGVSSSDLERVVFPGLDLGVNPGIIL